MVEEGESRVLPYSWWPYLLRGKILSLFRRLSCLGLRLRMQPILEEGRDWVGTLDFFRIQDGDARCLDGLWYVLVGGLSPLTPYWVIRPSSLSSVPS